MIPATQSAESGYSNSEHHRGAPIAAPVSASRASPQYTGGERLPRRSHVDGIGATSRLPGQRGCKIGATCAASCLVRGRPNQSLSLSNLLQNKLQDETRARGQMPPRGINQTYRQEGGRKFAQQANECTALQVIQHL